MASTHKGRGLEFDEVRPYSIGDEVRDVDAKVTARRGSLYVKRYVEERQRTFWMVLDQTRSMSIGEPVSKRQAAIESLALVALWAADAGDRVGFITYGEHSQRIAAKPSREHVLASLARLLSEGKPENLSPRDIVPVVRKLALRGSVIVVASDFFDLEQQAWNWIALRNDLFAFHIVHESEERLAPVGFVPLQDVETGETRWVDTTSRRVRESFADRARQRLRMIREWMLGAGADYIRVKADQMTLDTIIKHFAWKR